MSRPSIHISVCKNERAADNPFARSWSFARFGRNNVWVVWFGPLVGLIAFGADARTAKRAKRERVAS